MPGLWYGLPHPWNGNHFGKPKLSVHVLCEPKEFWNENYILFPFNYTIPLLTKLGPPYVVRKLPYKALFPPESQQKIWQIPLYLWWFSLRYIIYLVHTQKPKRHIYYCIASTPAFAISPPHKAGRNGLVVWKVYGWGFGGKAGSDFEGSGRQTRTDKLKSTLSLFMLNLCSFSEENLPHRWMNLAQKKTKP